MALFGVDDVQPGDHLLAASVMGMVVFTVFGVHSLRRTLWRRRTWPRVPGVVAGLKHGKGRQAAMKFTVVDFSTRDRRRVRAQDTDGSAWNRMKPGRPITVAYDPSDPQRFEIVSSRASVVNALIVPGFGFGIACGVLIMSLLAGG